MVQLAPSVLSADFSRLGEELNVIEKAGVKMLHIDVMDGTFVPNISLGMPVIQSMRKVSNMFFDVHLMVSNPDNIIESIAKCGADGITVHAETCTHLHRTIQNIKKLGLKVGVALNPATPINVLDYIIQDIDMVLIMTVNPGFGGQSYIEKMTQKIKDTRDMCNRLGLNTDIQVDGGISPKNAKEVIEAGATVLVAGSSVFGENKEERIKEFCKIFEEGRK
ncbi:ribulose-phosphate 3-epimerase [Tyzzerella sp. An114]|uniref:ribulose-phosphate 3-epimerase n=1 Tax=Tyzzerella sp. An114 TaxID=1965545 RepID=UPI000B44FEBE|nr:ribulose-phosphate 3-epimerase [Tyzzerella sp. An114]OUQ60072.1 ribulose-phosphate 3-epimerase [Tyzzerella sp. An114]HIT72938.1 ribulose-phosphate 3-epimerase [Candidatus Fimicola cottocaccae]